MPVTKAELLGTWLSNRIVMGFNDGRQIGVGWHNLETYPIHLRWTEHEALLYLALRCSSESRVLYMALAGWSWIKGVPSHGLREPEVSVLLDGDLLGKFQAPTKFELVTVDIKEIPEEPGKVLEVTTSTDRVIVPDKILKNGDKRELGVAVCCIGLESEHFLQYSSRFIKEKLDIVNARISRRSGSLGREGSATSTR